MTADNFRDYRLIGNINRAQFNTDFTRTFSGTPSFSASALPNILTLLGLIERDAAIIDIRWAAYMLATVMWETTSPTIVTRTAVNNKGRALVDKNGQPIILKERKWLITMDGTGG